MFIQKKSDSSTAISYFLSLDHKVGTVFGTGDRKADLHVKFLRH